MDKILLTQFSKSGGCGCKIAPAVLRGILDGQLPGNKNSNILVGFDSFDDAAVVAINETDCIITTTDFFTPIVNDAFDFGRIAAANAISDVYAMGGKPITAISVLGFPVDKIPVEIVREIIAGAQKTCSNAGISIAGGHSIDAPEPFFGLCVTGIIKKQNIKRNNTARAGNKLYLTKPLGTGVYSSAMKKGLLAEEDYKTFFANTSQLNSIGEILGTLPYVNAMTDVTGFGLLGHLTEMCEGSNVSAEIITKNIPLLPNLKTYTDQSCTPGNTYRNWNANENKIQGITPETLLILNDPQTNGGLLIAVEDHFEKEFLEVLSSNNCANHCIGKLIEDSSFKIYLQNN
jgi:selenide,water dikinase